jgi:hypothetical protein
MDQVTGYFFVDVSNSSVAGSGGGYGHAAYTRGTAL